MPQLDKVTFLSQFFWLCFFFFGFYIFQLKYFLPEMSRILKFRKKTLNQSSAFTLQEETSKVRNSASTVLENLLKNSKNVFKNSSLTSDNWFSNYAIKLNQNNFKKGNVRYLQSIAEKSLSNNLAMLAVNHDFSEKMFSSKLLERLLVTSQKSLSLKSRNYTTASKRKDSKNDQLKLEQNKESRNDPLANLKKAGPNNTEKNENKSTRKKKN